MSPAFRERTLLRTCAPALLVAMSVRLAAAGLLPELRCYADECWYLELSRALEAGHGFLPARGHLWPPGYALFLYAHDAAPQLARFTQCLLSTVTILMCAVLVAACLGRRAAAATAWILALAPTLVAFSHYLWPETVHLFAFIAATTVFLECDRRVRAGRRTGTAALAAGVGYGIACLVRSVTLYFVGLAAVWIALRGIDRRRSLAAAGLTLASFALTLLPWAAYASWRYERIVAVEATLGLNLWRGNNVFLPFDADYGVVRPIEGGYAPCDDANPIDRDRCNAARALAHVAAHPFAFFERVPTKMADLWTPTSFLVRHLRLGLYGDLPGWLVEALVLLDVGWWVLVAVAAVLGLALPVAEGAEADRARALRSFVLLLVAYTCAVHAITFGMSRFRLPLYPFLAAFAAHACVERGRLGEIARRPASLVATGVAIAALVAIWLFRVGSVWPHRSV